jgi:hypothetical protein
MARLGRRLEAARAEASERPPFVTWHPDLASLAGVPGAVRGGAAYGSRRRLVAARRGRSWAAATSADDAAAARELGFARGVLGSRLRRLRRRYDLVVAGYVLSEVAGPRERAALVARLWSGWLPGKGVGGGAGRLEQGPQCGSGGRGEAVKGCDDI